MRLPTLVLLVTLAAAAVLALVVRARREVEIRPDPFLAADPLGAARKAEAERSLGIALAAYAAIEEGDPGFPEAVRGRLRNALRIAAVTFPTPDTAAWVGEQIDVYLQFRELADADGACLQEAVEEWLRLRLALDPRHSAADYYRQVAAATFLAARGDESGTEALLEHARNAPFHLHFLPFVRTLHPGWRAVRPVVEFYLGHEKLEARVEAAVTLLVYLNLYGEGADLRKENEERIRSDLADARKRLRTELPGSDFGIHAPAILAGTALLGGPQEARAVRDARDPDYAAHVDLLRITRLWMGFEPLDTYALGGRNWELLDSRSQFFLFEAAVHRLVALRREHSSTTDPKRRARLDDEIARAADVAEAGLVADDSVVVILCLQGLVLARPEDAPTLLRNSIEEGGVAGVVAAALTEVEDPVALLLPILLQPAPQYAALAASALLGWEDAPSALARPVR
jgi:hypothetical protein